MSLQSNIIKVRRYVPLAHYITAILMLGASAFADENTQVWFIVAAVLSVAAGLGFYAFMRHVERKLGKR